MERVKSSIMRDKSLSMDLTLSILNHPSIPHQFALANPLPASQAIAVEVAQVEEATPSQRMLGEFSFILTTQI